VGDWIHCVHSDTTGVGGMDQEGFEMIKYKQQGDKTWRGQQTVQT
jgi:hypothetical protein